ncbi:MAG: hypothetical protein OEV87_11315 [Phycisphaerae bacterium]|nr:hypothetical protein [Phycisphaerae bacterium]
MNSQQLAVISVLMGVVFFSGCEGLRYAATEAQKENAWLHRQVCAAAADAANDENASQRLCDLTATAHEQSTVFVADYGLPLRQAQGRPETVEALLGRGTVIVNEAKADSLRKPDTWALADSAMELGIALAGLVGGVYGIRIAGAIKTAREKSKALKEIVAGNELFKQLYPEQADRFKDAQQKQSPETKQIVTAIKST